MKEGLGLEEEAEVEEKLKGLALEAEGEVKGFGLGEEEELVSGLGGGVGVEEKPKGLALAAEGEVKGLCFEEELVNGLGGGEEKVECLEEEEVKGWEESGLGLEKREEVSKRGLGGFGSEEKEGREEGCVQKSKRSPLSSMLCFFALSSFVLSLLFLL